MSTPSRLYNECLIGLHHIVQEPPKTTHSERRVSFAINIEWFTSHAKRVSAYMRTGLFLPFSGVFFRAMVMLISASSENSDSLPFAGSCASDCSALR